MSIIIHIDTDTANSLLAWLATQDASPILEANEALIHALTQTIDAPCDGGWLAVAR